MKTHRIFAIATAICLSLPAFPVDAEIDRKRMKQDLDIMEGILQNLHAQNTPRFAGIHRGPQVRGLHFDNYGVIFLIEEERPPGSGSTGRVALQVLAARSEEQEVDDVIEDIRAKRKERRQTFRERLGEFLGTYADGIRQLEGENRITILVHFEPMSPFPFHIDLDLVAAGLSDKHEELRAITRQLHSDSLNVSPRPRRKVRHGQVLKARSYNAMSELNYSEVTAKKGDIMAYRRERISEAEFRKRIVSREHRPDASTMKKIGVMAAIMDKVLKHPSHTLSNSEKTLGIYKDGLGALFLVHAGSGYRRDYRVTIAGKKTSVIHRARTGKALKGQSEIKDQLVEDVVNVVGDYGYSLRTLKPDEYIVVDVRFPRGFRRRTSDPRGLVLKVKKRDVDAYSRGDLDLAAFRQKADIQEY